ncbi:nitrilase-related carbon-nitrogen hydrolase [Roseomonas sp. BN140053]|uniref:nitrilase-related carbon-nitrogen hydrolase n=1 Tax=Roseomonas sp. BN140053 TaxID=3391898 RepID=UPI0039E8D8BB
MPAPQPDTLRLAAAPFAPRPGDPAGNARRILHLRAEAAAAGADLLVLPPYALAGFPPELHRPGAVLLRACAAAAEHLAAATADGGPGLVLGTPWQDGSRCHHGAVLLDGGAVLARRACHVAPGPFDPGPPAGPAVFRGLRLGLLVGADWHGPDLAETLSESGAELLLALDAEPFAPGGAERRVDRAVARVVETGLPLLLLNALGADGERVFDGASFALNADRSLPVSGPLFAPGGTPSEWRRDEDGWHARPAPLHPLPGPEEATWRALVLALRARVEAGDHPGILLDLAGDRPGALLAAAAADALGPGRVRAAVLSAPGTAEAAPAAARALAARLRLRCDTLVLGPALDGLRAVLPGAAEGAGAARLRGAVLRGLAETSGELLLTAATRGALLLGPPVEADFAPFKHLDEAALHRLARWRDAARPAGLPGPDAGFLADLPGPAPGDPPGSPLGNAPENPPGTDAILTALLAGDADLEALGRDGHARDAVLHVWRRLQGAARDRGGVPPGPALGGPLAARAFARDWRYPLCDTSPEAPAPAPPSGPEGAASP